MIIFGSYYIHGEKLGQIHTLCPNCNKEVIADVRISNKIGHVWYIPLIPMGKDLIFICHECGKYSSFVDKKHKLDVLKHFKRLPKNTTYEEVLKNSGTNGALYCLPAWLVIAGLIMWGIFASTPTTNVYENYNYVPEYTEEDLTDDVKPYVDAIVKNDQSLRQKAIEVSKDCWSGDKECQLISIYEYVIQNIKYYSDPRDDEYIQTPYQTLEIGGGDCEDLTVLLNSLLENIGIKTYLVLTEDHAYSLACDFDMDLLQNYTIATFITTEELSRNRETITLSSGETWYFGGDESYSGNLWYVNISLDASKPVTMFTVPTANDYDLFMDDEEFTYYEDCYKQSITQTESFCVFENTGGIVIYNDGYGSSTIKLDITTYEEYALTDLEKIQINYYEINGEKCVILDPSLGEFGYVGYDTQITGEKIAIDPITYEQYQLID